MVSDLSGGVPGLMGICTLGTISVFSPIIRTKMIKTKPLRPQGFVSSGITNQG